MNSPKNLEASVLLLESMHVIFKKCQKDVINDELMPLLYSSMDHNSNQIQVTETLWFLLTS